MEDIDSLVKAHELTEEDAKMLQQLLPGAYCTHRDWGFGKIAKWDVPEGMVYIDFDARKGHGMQVEYALDSLKPVPPSHIAARIRSDIAHVRKQATDAPVDLMTCVVQSLGEQATQAAIETALCPAVISQADWKGWWDGTKKKMKASKSFQIPTARREPIRLGKIEQSAPVDLGADSEVTGILPVLHLAQNALKHIDQVKERQGELSTLLERIETTLRMPITTQKGDRLKLALVRDEIAQMTDKQPSEDVKTSRLLQQLGGQLANLLLPLPAASQKQILEAIRESHTEEDWPKIICTYLSVANNKLVDEMHDFFESHDKVDYFTDQLHRGIRDQSLSSDVLIWIFKHRKTAMGKKLIEPRLFSALIAAIERDQMGDRKSTRLHDLVISDTTLLTDLVDSAGKDLASVKGKDVVHDAGQDAMRDVTRGLMLTAVFDEMDKRSLLARIIKRYPEAHTIVTAGIDRSRSATQNTLMVSWPSLEKRKAEFDDLVNRQIPANTKEIEVARSYGDLSENAEFKFAKEQQRVLGRRRAELEADLVRAQGTDFKDTDISSVGMGCKVVVKSGDKTESFSILGAWDSDPSQGIISYLTPMAKALRGKKIGEEVSLPTEKGETRTVQIHRIEACSI